MKILKNIAVLISLVVTLQANNISISLNDFADKVSKQLNINIVIDDDLKDSKFSLFIPNKISNKDLFYMFNKVLNKHDYNFKKHGGTYYLSKKVNFPIKGYVYNLKYNSSKDCIALLKLLGYEYTYLSSINSLVIKAKERDYKSLTTKLSKIDKEEEQVLLKLYILEFSDNLIEESGIQYTSIFKDASKSLQYAVNTIIFPISSSNPTLTNVDFYGALRFLNEKKVINVKQNPFILAKNNQPFNFEAVQNLPYLISTTTTQATNTSEQNSIEYKDVGLKINGLTRIHNEYITLDLDLVIEDLLNNDSEDTMPVTYKRTLKSNANINYDEVLLLSGLKRVKHNNNTWSIPLISEIPYLGALFRYDYETEEVINISIAVEIIDNNSSISNNITNDSNITKTTIND